MADNSVQIRVGADLAKMHAAIGTWLPDECARGAKAAAAGLAPMERGILSSRESTRLLAEEMGVHLPRAVTNAIAEIMPGLGMMGGAFLGAFAIQELPKAIAFMKDASEWLGGFHREYKDLLGDAEKFSKEAGEDFRKIAEQAAKAIYGGEPDKIKREHEEREYMIDQGKRALGIDAAQVQAIQHRISALQQEEAEAKAAADLAGLAPDKRGAAQDKAAEAARREASAQLELDKALDRQNKDFIAFIDLQDRAIPGVKKVAEAHEHLTRAVDAEMVTFLRNVTIQQKAGKGAEDAAKQTKAYGEQLEFAAKAELNTAINLEILTGEQRKAWDGAVVYIDNIVDRGEVLIQQQTRMQQAIKFTESAQNEAMVAEGARLVASVGFRRVSAGIEAGWETAKGIASLAEQDYKGAALHFMSAAEYGIVAGSGGGHRGGGGGGAGAGYGYGGREPRFLNAQGREGGGRGAASPRGSDGGTTVHVYVQGDFLNTPGTADKLCEIISEAVDSRDAHLSASRVKDSTLSRDSFNG